MIRAGLDRAEVNVASQGRILVVDDEPKIRSFIGRALAAAGYSIDFSGSGAEGVRSAVESRYDLVILDLVMPDLDGRQVLGKLLAARPDQAVIVLSCVADVAAKVDLLERGAQDYLTKPFSLAELLARVKVRLRAEPPAYADAPPVVTEPAITESAITGPGITGPGVTGPGVTGPGVTGPVGTPVALAPPFAPPQAVGHVPAEVIRAGDVTLDVTRLVADIGAGPVPLTRLEFLLLRELAEHAGESVSKGKLLASVWGYDFDPGSNVVDVCVRRLRSKLGFDLIKTVRGEGYQLVTR
jgi:DNA-binding response OmpR family regulator